jgi:hypothetical protein
LLNEPTAVQARLEVHETPFKALQFARGGVGARSIAQRTPFQRPTRTKVPRLLENEPTAVQARGEVHDTPSSVLLFDPPGIGTGHTDQREGLAAPALGASPRAIMHPATMHIHNDLTG